MNKRLIVLVTLIALALLAVSAVAAQGNGNGRGPANPNNDSPPNGNGYRNQFGGVDSVQPETGQPWNRGPNASRGQMGLHALLPPAVEGELPEAVIEAMIDGINDERAAYAVYESVIAQFGEIQPFTNIMAAEAQHESAWEFMFERYGVELPAAPAIDVPQFASVAEACQSAVDAEVANAGLYDNMMTTFADYPDLLQVATALRNASNYNHLPAFQNCAS